MNEVGIINLIIAFGALGLLHYGIAQLSFASQYIFDHFFKKLAIKISHKPLYSMAAGLLITAMVQSSTTTTLMAVFLLNAGLISFRSGMGVVLGANIGGAFLPWIFTFHTDTFSFFFIALGAFPSLISRNNQLKQFGRLLLSLGLIFYGLGVLVEVLNIILKNYNINDYSFFSGNFLPQLTIIIVGITFSCILRSSSTMMAIIITLAELKISVPLHVLFALIIGTNLGGGIITILSSHRGNFNARHLAFGHGLFNLVGGIWSFALLYIFHDKVIDLFANLGITDRGVISALAYTIFNSVTVIVCLPGLKQIEGLLNYLFPKEEKDFYDSEAHLDMMGNPEKMLPGVALVVSAKEIIRYQYLMERFFKLTYDYLCTSDKDAKILAKIKNFENIADRRQREMSQFVSALMEKELSSSQSYEGQEVIKITTELEAISDILDKMAIIRTKLGTNFNSYLYPESKVISLFLKTHIFYQDSLEFIKDKAIQSNGRTYQNPKNREDLNKFFERSKGLKETVAKLKLNVIETERLSNESKVMIIDLLAEIREIRGRSIQILLAFK